MNDADLARLSQETDNSEPSTANLAPRELELLRWDNRRMRSALPAPQYVGEPATEDWTERLVTHPSEQYETRSLADVQRLVIHHSAVPAEVGPEKIAHFQVELHGWPGIGYHYFITAPGEILMTNSLETICYHTRFGSETGVGICLAGRFDVEGPANQQLDAVARLCAHLCGRLGLHAELGGIVGHSELVETDCPGSQWNQGVRWREELFARIAQLQATERRRQDRALGHFMLFWQDAESWDTTAWDAAREYIGRFRPLCGFSWEEASQADYVTIVGDESRFPPAVEEYLREAGCVVERISADGDARLREIFAGMVKRNQRFLTLGL